MCHFNRIVIRDENTVAGCLRGDQRDGGPNRCQRLANSAGGTEQQLIGSDLRGSIDDVDISARPDGHLITNGCDLAQQHILGTDRLEEDVASAPCNDSSCPNESSRIGDGNSAVRRFGVGDVEHLCSDLIELNEARTCLQRGDRRFGRRLVLDVNVSGRTVDGEGGAGDFQLCRAADTGCRVEIDGGGDDVGGAVGTRFVDGPRGGNGHQIAIGSNRVDVDVSTAGNCDVAVGRRRRGDGQVLDANLVELNCPGSSRQRVHGGGSRCQVIDIHVADTAAIDSDGGTGDFQLCGIADTGNCVEIDGGGDDVGGAIGTQFVDGASGGNAHRIAIGGNRVDVHISTGCGGNCDVAAAAGNDGFLQIGVADDGDVDIAGGGGDAGEAIDGGDGKAADSFGEKDVARHFTVEGNVGDVGRKPN